MPVTLDRSYTPWGVIGNLSVPDCGRLKTLERPWLDNAPYFSCIPLGDYVCRRIVSPKFGDTYEVCAVEGRDHILFHSLNTISNTKGCIGVGLSLQLHKNEIFLSSSKDAMRLFLAALAGVNEFSLSIALRDPDRV